MSYQGVTLPRLEDYGANRFNLSFDELMTKLDLRKIIVVSCIDPRILFDCPCLSRSGKSHHNFSLSSLVGVIQHAGNKRSSQGPIGNKLSTATAESTRPSSSQSVNIQSGTSQRPFDCCSAQVFFIYLSVIFITIDIVQFT